MKIKPAVNAAAASSESKHLKKQELRI